MTNAENPYAAPESETISKSDVGLFDVADFKKLEKLYYRSCNLRGLALFSIFMGPIIWVSLADHFVRYESDSQIDSDLFLTIVIVLIFLFWVNTFGLFQRSNWGRIYVIVSCFIMQINIGMGTIVGIIGLFALFGAPELFGKDKLKHKDLAQIFKEQKRQYRFAKKEKRLKK